ncbi:MAG: glycosyltransferase [Desulfobacteraceae bacterium]|jgi:glycosyltransferase involved in cell wall biosynthesis
MKIAFIHYHLRQGGVTTVIRQQVEAIRAAGWQAVVLSGDTGAVAFPAEVISLPELGYDSPFNENCDPEAIAHKIIQALNRHWPGGADIVHVHNPTLAKNRHMQAVLKALQGSGVTLLCQIHDFAEDGRTDVYYQEDYVQNCHYAVINPRDEQLLIKAGLRRQGCHLLRNTITSLHRDGDDSRVGDYVLYPIRAIRRKNIGEAILLSLYFDPGVHLAVTLPPNSPKDLNSYHQWRSFARRHDLCVKFEVGVGADFPALVARCQYVLTTSITEGFGFAFLEPWTARKALLGRLLPNTCQGFIAQGIQLDHLYTRFLVPLSWIDAKSFEMKWKNAMRRSADQLAVPLAEGDADRAWRLVSGTGRIDFGLLDEISQQRIIRKVLKESRAADRLKRLNPFLAQPVPPSSLADRIDHNFKRVTQLYHLKTYERQLKKVYAAVAASPVRHGIDKSVLASAFLEPHEFSLLKWGDGR